MRGRNLMTHAFTNAVACMAILSLSGLAHADGAIVYHDYFVEPPGEILIGSTEIDLEFWMVGYTKSPLEEMCRHQERTRSGVSVANESPIFYIGSGRFDVPDGARCLQEDLQNYWKGRLSHRENLQN